MSKKQIKQLKAENEALKLQLAFYEKRCKRIEENYDLLLHQVKQLMRDRFDSKSERFAEEDNPQRSLLDDDSGSQDESDKDSNEDDSASGDNVVNIACCPQAS